MTHYLAQGVLHNGRLYRNSIVYISSGDKVVIKPFSMEEPSTVFVSGIVAICAISRVNDSHRKALDYIVKGADLMEKAFIRAARYLDSHQLYIADSADKPCLILLPRK